ncbi:hypothetical protein Tco_0680233 [Tanacetum coccineum]|uniref:Xylulose kinase-1 n=1 Tax=Tanacetum coccineum TaxID=301880 RepID=A0ABQ4XK97_9ASTR
MANLEFCDKHNMVAYLEKSEGSEGFHQIIDFLNACHIKYALTENPTIYVSFIKQFWSTATARTRANGEVELSATIDGQVKTLTEASLRRHLKLEDNGGVTTLPNSEIFEHLALMGYATDSEKLTFQKGDILGVDIALFPTMLIQGQTLEGVESIAAPSTLQPPFITPILTPETHQSPHSSPTMPTSHKAEEPATMPHDSPLPRVHTLGSDEDDEEGQEDPSNQGRSLIKELDLDAEISLVPPHDTEIPKKTSGDTEILLQEEEPTELVEDFGSGEKGNEVSTATPERQQTNEEERQQIARDAEIAKQLQEDIYRASQEQEKQRVVTKADPTKVIDWSDPSVIRYHVLQNRPRSVAEVRKNICKYLCNQGGYKMINFKGMTYDDISLIFEKVWDQIYDFVPLDSELVIPKSKGAESVKKSSTEEEKKKDDSSKPAESKRKKTLARKRASGKDSEESAKRQKLEEDTKKEEIQVYLNIVPVEEGLDVESLATKYPIVDSETQILAIDKYYYQIKRADGSVKHYKIFSAILYDFDRQDVLELYKLVKERFQTAILEGYDLLLWGDLQTMLEPYEEDDIWRNQQDWNLINWKLHNFCGVHVILMNTGLVIHMMVEKKYSLSQDTLSKMLNRRLEVDHQSEMGYELIKFIRLFVCYGVISSNYDVTVAVLWTCGSSPVSSGIVSGVPPENLFLVHSENNLNLLNQPSYGEGLDEVTLSR